MPLACWPVHLPSLVQILLVRHVRNKNLGGHLFPHSLCIGDPRKRLDLPEQLAGLLLGRKRLTALLTAKVAFMQSVIRLALPSFNKSNFISSPSVSCPDPPSSPREKQEPGRSSLSPFLMHWGSQEASGPA